MGTKICMFTGHRTIATKDLSILPEKLGDLLEKLIAKGYTEFRTGGAIGFDTLAALKVLEKKEKYPEVKLHLYLPCRDQDKKWEDNLKSAYHYVLERADSIRYCSESYNQGCMMKRNREMVNGAEICVAYCKKSSGGSAYTVGYAEKKGLTVINLSK